MKQFNHIGRYDYLSFDKYFSESKKFEIVSNYPKTVYQINEHQNLEELGFYPNAALFL